MDELRKIIEKAFDESELDSNQKNEICDSTEKFFGGQISVNKGEKDADEASFELSEDLLFTLIKGKKL